MTSTADSSMYNLVDERWLNARLLDGSTTTLSLREAFHRAHEVRELVGELPTQTFAILRLMLAILYRLGRGRPLTEDLWQSWRETGLPLDLVDRYLDHFRDRFNLFDPRRPFFQVADLTLGNAKLQDEKMRDVTPLIFDLPTRNRLFTTRSGTGAVDLSFAEAARWVINAQAFDVSGIKSGANGDSRVTGGKGLPIGVGWSGLLGGIYACGQSLRDTLLLNLIPAASFEDPNPSADIPPWEDEEPDTAAERKDLIVSGPVRLYTWQSRRIRLFSSGDRVVGCIIANGDKLTPQNMQRFEPMTAWRFSEPQSKAAKQTTYMPRGHMPGRALWRGIGALLPGAPPRIAKREVDAWIMPGTVRRLEALAGDNLIEASELLRLRSVGVVYGSQSAVVDEVLDDGILIPLALLRDHNRALATQAERAVALADEGVLSLRRLAENLERAAGGEGEGARERVGDLAYAALDDPYRAWLSGLTDSDDPLDAIADWKGIARGVFRALGSELVAAASPAAWIGREVSRGGKTELITTPRAEAWYLRALAKTFGATHGKDQAA